VVVAIRRWPEGLVCSGCVAKACETYGRCAGCGIQRLVPGIGKNGEALCTNCAGGLGDYTCTRCGAEGLRYYVGICGRCVLKDQLTVLLEDGTGAVRPELVPFFDLLCAMPRPRSGILWLTKPHVPPILRALARSQVPLTHDGLDTLQPYQSIIHIRDLLVGCGVLPPVDRFLFLFERWLPGWIQSIQDPNQRKILQRFATWQILRQLRTTAATQPIGHYRNQGARTHLRQAQLFLDDLAGHGRELGQCTQTDVDRWFAAASPANRTTLRPFLLWAVRSRQVPKLRLPATVPTSPTPISQKQRVALIRRIHAGTDMDLTDRVIALLILLYAQPLTRIVRLTINDVTHDGEQVFIRLGDPPVPVPAPFAEVVTQYLASRSNQTTATNPASRLLFPGRRAGQPMHPTSIRQRLRPLGIPNLNGRSRAIRELLLQAPAPVVAAMIGYHTGHTEQLASEAGATWKRYAVGDHARTRKPPPPIN
jgi:integrase